MSKRKAHTSVSSCSTKQGSSRSTRVLSRKRIGRRVSGYSNPSTVPKVAFQSVMEWFKIALCLLLRLDPMRISRVDKSPLSTFGRRSMAVIVVPHKFVTCENSSVHRHQGEGFNSLQPHRHLGYLRFLCWQLVGSTMHEDPRSTAQLPLEHF